LFFFFIYDIIELLPKEIKSSLLNSGREKLKGSFKTRLLHPVLATGFWKKVCSKNRTFSTLNFLGNFGQ